MSPLNNANTANNQSDNSNSTNAATDVSISEWIANAFADTSSRSPMPVFGGHGGALVPLVNAVAAHPKLQFIYARNEHDAATMAAAYAKLTGELGVVIATSGPGATNLTTGLMEAVMDRVPLLAITGLKPTAVMGHSEFQDVTQSRLFAAAGLPFSKNAASPHGTIPLLRDAVATALSQRSAAHLAIPVDIQGATSPLPLKHFCASHADVRLHPPVVNDDYIQEAAATLIGTPQEYPPRTVIAVGHMANLTDDRMSKTILDLAEALNAPVLTRLDAKGVVDEDHPLAFGVIGVHGKPGLETAALLISTADIVLSIGVQDETLLLCNTAGLQIRRLVEIQPDALAVSSRYNADHTLLGNVHDVVTLLTEEVERISLKVQKKRALEKGRKRCHRKSGTDQFSYMNHEKPESFRLSQEEDEETMVQKLTSKADQLWDAMHGGNWVKLQDPETSRGRDSCARHGESVDESNPDSSSTSFCHPSAVLDALSKLRLDSATDTISRDSVITVDVGDVTLWASLCLALTGGSRTLYSERLGTMGYALNAAVAAILARPSPAGATVLAGDSGFQMSLQELATFQQMRRPGDKLLCIIFDNQVMGRVAFGFDNAFGCNVAGPDYVALGKAFGGDGAVLDDSCSAPEAVKKAMEADGLFILHVVVDPEVKADMATFKDKDNALAVVNSG